MKNTIKYKSVTILSTIFSVSLFGSAVGEANSNVSPIAKENILLHPLKMGGNNKIILTKTVASLQQSIKEQEEIITDEETKLNLLTEENKAFNINQKEQLSNIKGELEVTLAKLLAENRQLIAGFNQDLKLLMSNPDISDQNKASAKAKILSQIDEVNKRRYLTERQAVDKFERKEQEILASTKQTNEDYEDKGWQHERNIINAKNIKAQLVDEINSVLKDKSSKSEPVKVENLELSNNMAIPVRSLDDNKKAVNEAAGKTANNLNDEAKTVQNLNQGDKSTPEFSNNDTLNTAEKVANNGKSLRATIQNLGVQENDGDVFNALSNNFSDIWNILGEASQALNDNNHKLVNDLSNILSQGIDELSAIVDKSLAPQANFNVKTQDTLNDEELYNNSLPKSTNRGGEINQSLNHKAIPVNIMHDKTEIIVKEDKKQESTEISNQPAPVKSLITNPGSVVEQIAPIVNEIPKALNKPAVVKAESGAKVKADNSNEMNGKTDLLVKENGNGEANGVDKAEVKASVNVLQAMKPLIQEVQNKGKQVQNLASMPVDLPETAVKEKSDRILALLVCIGALFVLMSSKLVDLKNKQK